jgi:glycosyltransferase involved in cell wall biosynthesis
VARVAFYDPYLDVLGGGEKFLLTILEQVAGAGRHEVVVMSPMRPDIAKWERLNISVDPRSIRWRRANQASATVSSSGVDLFVALTNHFPPLSLARRSVMIVQFPFADLEAGGLWSALRRGERRRRIASYESVVCYSPFVAAEVRRRLGVAEPLVLAPPVDLPAAAHIGEKEPIVLAVGRFFPAADANNKKHDVLIDAWRRLAGHPRAEGWELHLVGGLHSDLASLAHLEALRERGRGLAVHFHPNAEPGELQDLYGRSALFWHAAGYGESRPERQEHFGITTVEAMAYGCAPIVVALGGQLGIVVDGHNSRLRRTTEELVSITAELMGDPEQATRLGGAATCAAAQFGKEHFLASVRSEICEPAGVAA